MKLLAADFDKTLFKENDFEKNIMYINKFVDEGNIFVIATGRTIGGLLDAIKDYNINYGFLICKDGGIIFDKNLKILYQQDIYKNDISDIATILEQSKYIDDWYIDTGLETIKDKNSSANSIIGRFNNREEAYKLLNVIKTKYKSINGYISTRWVNVSNRYVNKGDGIIQLLKLININEEDVYTIGDDINDVPMCNYHFNCFCMKDSIPELKNKTIREYNAVYELVKDILKDELK